jgi:hypothetical protein
MANVVPISPIHVTLMTETLLSSERPGLIRATGLNIPEDTVLQSHCREDLKPYIQCSVSLHASRSDTLRLFEEAYRRVAMKKRFCGRHKRFRDGHVASVTLCTAKQQDICCSWWIRASQITVRLLWGILRIRGLVTSCLYLASATKRALNWQRFETA